jgi:hypothetical protein
MNHSSRRASARGRRARLWLNTAAVVHVIVMGAINGVVASSLARPTATAAVVSVLATGPLLMMVWYERRNPSANRPTCWPARALAASLPQGAAVAMIASGLLGETVHTPWGYGVALACATLLVQVGPAVLASRTLRHPLTPELGEMSVEVLVHIRSNRGVSAWLEYDDVRLTDQQIITIVRPNLSWKWMICIPLIDVTAVEVRPGTPKDNPWIRIDDALAYDLPPGDVVVIHHRQGTQVLPIHNAAAFAEVIRVRAGKIQGSPIEHSRHDTEQ